jgi:HEAT repeat protein
MGLSSWLGSHLLSRSLGRSVPDLLERLRAEDPQVREDAANSLWGRAGRLDPAERREVEPALRTVASGDANGLARANAAVALLELDAPNAVDLALDVLHHPAWAARAIAASQLGRAEDPRIVDALVPLLRDEEGMVRELAAASLGLQRDPRALEPLREMVRTERKDVVARKAAKKAIKDLERAAAKVPDGGGS